MFSFLNRDRKNLIARNAMLELANDKLLDERRQLKQDLADIEIRKAKEIKELELAHKISDEDIKHMTKIKEEKLEIAHERKVIEMERKKETEVAKVKDEYRDKLEKQLAQETANIKEMYGQILERLPNVNVKMTGSV